MEELLRKFNLELVEKNKAVNLTAHKTEEESWKENILDSLLFLSEFPKSAKVLDIGSGCGCPAIPLKIALPDLDITMIDSVNKKVLFLNETVQKLGLSGITAVHTRIEDYKERGFDIVTARAVAPLPTLLEYALHFLKTGGRLFAFKGSKWQEEINASVNALKILGGLTEIKLHDNSRCLIIITKVKITDKKYPRGKNLPRLKPL
jgi:16S rRNA (guanine527-N7)-methyltransferase